VGSEVALVGTRVRCEGYSGWFKENGVVRDQYHERDSRWGKPVGEILSTDFTMYRSLHYAVKGC
jgi:hypothetical protein